MTPYRERREAGHYNPPGAPKKTKADRAKTSTTSSNVGGLTGKRKGKS